MAHPKPKIALTGATGLVGGAILRRLAADRYPLLALVRKPSKLAVAGIRTVSFDLDDITPAARKHIEDFAPDVVIHAAWLGTENTDRNRPEYAAINRHASLQLLDIARAAGCRRWIGFGSQAEYAPGISHNIGEDAPLDPDTAYGRAKRDICEALQAHCLAAGMDFAWLRLFTCYGKEYKPSYVIPYLIACLREGKLPALKNPHAVWDCLHTDDAADAIAGLLEHKGGNGIYNLCRGEGVSVGQIALILAEHLQFPAINDLHAAIESNRATGTRRVGDSAKFTRATGWSSKMDIRLGLLKCL